MIPICPRHPGITGIIRLVSLRSCSHRHLTSPPSLRPGRELRKYHYRCLLSSPSQEQLGIFSRMDRSSQNRGSWRSAAQAIPDSNVVLFPGLPDDCVFSFQSPHQRVAPADGLSLVEIGRYSYGAGVPAAGLVTTSHISSRRATNVWITASSCALTSPSETFPSTR